MAAALLRIVIIDRFAERPEAAREIHLIHFLELLIPEQSDAVPLPGRADGRETRIVERLRKIDAADFDSDRRRKRAYLNHEWTFFRQGVKG